MGGAGRGLELTDRLSWPARLVATYEVQNRGPGKPTGDPVGIQALVCMEDKLSQKLQLFRCFPHLFNENISCKRNFQNALYLYTMRFESCVCMRCFH